MTILKKVKDQIARMEAANYPLRHDANHEESLMLLRDIRDELENGHTEKKHHPMSREEARDIAGNGAQ